MVTSATATGVATKMENLNNCGRERHGIGRWYPAHGHPKIACPRDAAERDLRPVCQRQSLTSLRCIAIAASVIREAFAPRRTSRP